MVGSADKPFFCGVSLRLPHSISYFSVPRVFFLFSRILLGVPCEKERERERERESVGAIAKSIELAAQLMALILWCSVKSSTDGEC